MEIETIALLTLSSIVVATSTYTILIINCRRRREVAPLAPIVPVVPVVPVAPVVPPKDWGIHNPVALNSTV
jgi:hypothetical protein